MDVLFSACGFPQAENLPRISKTLHGAEK